MNALPKSRFARAVLLLVCTLALCIGSNMLAFCIDSSDMRQNIRQGCLMLGEQEGMPQTVGGFPSAQLDNYTSILILKTAGYTGEQPLMHKALGGLRVDIPAENGQRTLQEAWQAYCQYVSGSDAPDGSIVSYSRYWHGYTLALRLLLGTVDVANLQMLLYAAQLVALLLVLRQMEKRRLGALIPGFLITFFVMMPFSSAICLQYVPVTMLMLAANLCMLRWDEAIDRAVSLPAFFLLLGVLTNYLDLLTFPMTALGFSLILLLALRMQRGDSLASLFGLTVSCGVCWAVGFAGMWALKWLLNALVFGWASLANIFAQIGLRASDNAGEISRIAILMKNLNVILAKKSYLLLLLASVAATLFPAAKAILQRRRVTLDLRAAVLLLPGIACCLWVLVMANHANDHTYFTYRTLTACVFSGFACLSCLLTTPKEDAP